jgi:hypothetical protein
MGKKKRQQEKLYRIVGPFDVPKGTTPQAFLWDLASTVAADLSKSHAEVLQDLREGIDAGMLVLKQREDGAFVLIEDSEAVEGHSLRWLRSPIRASLFIPKFGVAIDSELGVAA